VTPSSSPRTLPEDNPESWLAGRCPLRVAADAIRGDPQKFRTLTFLASVWLTHEPHCKATQR
jgi:hypothetical protein